MSYCHSTRNMVAFPLSQVPVRPLEDFLDWVIDGAIQGERLISLFYRKNRTLCAVLADDSKGSLSVAMGEVKGDSYRSLTPSCPQAHLFERDIAERGGPTPEGHPWLKPVRFPLDGALGSSIGEMDFFQVQGEEVHEVAVGPVHAGVIEPGHFRFQCHGEIVLHLEISLGYQHRGLERVFTGARSVRQAIVAESVSGDCAAGHAGAYCGAVEALSSCEVEPKAWAVRCIAQELERIACHIGDLGAMAGDVGYLPTSSFCGRIRGDVLNLTALLCGNRFSRGLFRPGGVLWDIDEGIASSLIERMTKIRSEARDAIGLLWTTPTVMARFENTGMLSPLDCESLGLVGPAARACGSLRDVRYSLPYWSYRPYPMKMAVEKGGDVLSRARVRWMEIENSFDYIESLLSDLPDSPIMSSVGAPEPSSMVISMTEGWRGEIVHVAVTDEFGLVEDYRILDPSFHNWTGLAMSMRNRGISDFPLCNKSFNLSYCGFDL